MTDTPRTQTAKRPADGMTVINVRVPVDLKNRCVKRSQSEGMKLTDWITRELESALSRKERVD